MTDLDPDARRLIHLAQSGEQPGIATLKRCEQALFQRLMVTTTAVSLAAAAKGIGASSATSTAAGLRLSGAGAESLGIANSGAAVKLAAASTLGAAGHRGTSAAVGGWVIKAVVTAAIVAGGGSVGYRLLERSAAQALPPAGSRVLQVAGASASQPAVAAKEQLEISHQSSGPPNVPALEVALPDANANQSLKVRSEGKAAVPLLPSPGASSNAPRGHAAGLAAVAASSSAATSTLADEAFALTRTEQLIAAGRGQAALAVLSQSDQRFGAAGGLSVERQALRALVWCKSSSVNSRESGVSQAQRLVAAHPNSPLRGRLEAECFTRK